MTRRVSVTPSSSTAMLILALACLGGFGCGGGPLSTPDGTVRYCAHAVQNKQPELLWDALPPSYQSDLTGLKNELADRLDPQLYDSVISLIRKASTVLCTQRELIMTSSMAQRSGIDLDAASQRWQELCNFLDTIANSELGSLETLATADPRVFLASTVSTLMKQAAEVSKIAADDPYQKNLQEQLAALQVEVISSSGDVARIRITVPGEQPAELDMVRVEDRWVPRDLADLWPGAMESAGDRLAELDQEKWKQIRLASVFVLGAIEAVLDQIAAAETSQQVDQALEGLVMIGRGMTGAGLGIGR